MIDLEAQLRDLGTHLAHPSGDRIIPHLRATISEPIPGSDPQSQRSRRHRFVTVASVAAALLLALVIPPSRDAIVDVLGLGSSAANGPDRSAATHPQPHDRPTVTTKHRPAATSELGLQAARSVVDFPIGVPGQVADAPRVTVDHRVPGGLVALDYPTFRVVEVASPPDVAEELARMIPAESQLRTVSIRGRTGMWITGTHHEISYFDRDGNVRRGATRPTGHVLLWEENGVTYRVEGFADEASAMQLATSIV